MLDRRLVRYPLVAVILIAALVIRIEYVQQTAYKAKNDAGTYNRLASGIAETGDYQVGNGPHTGAGNSSGRTAYFPPGFPYFLAVADILDGHQAGGKSAVKGERIEQAIAGTIAVGLLGLVALEAFGATVALIAMVLGAVYPVTVVLSGTLVAENLLVVLELAAIWTALRARRAKYPWGWIAATGVLTGLATLTHQNAIVFLIPFAFAVVAATGQRAEPVVQTRSTFGSMGAQTRTTLAPEDRRNAQRRRARVASGLLLLLVTTVLMILPWTIRNSIELHHFIPVSDETGLTLVGTYNPYSAEFSPVPYKWRYYNKIPSDATLLKNAGDYTEVGLSSKLESQAFHYIGDHPFAPLVVAYHNTLRMFELEGSYAWHASAFALDIPKSNARLGVAAFWILCVLALAGIATRAARRAPLWLWAIPVLYALTIVFINVETPRFREPIDPFLLLLASCGVAFAFERAVAVVRAWLDRAREPTRGATA